MGQLGRGGMGTVFLAEHAGPQGFRKRVALKRPHASLGRGLLQLFFREARHGGEKPPVELASRMLAGVEGEE